MARKPYQNGHDMNKDEEIRLGLKSAGIPATIFGTTLSKEDAMPLRGMVTDGSLVKASTATGLYVYPKTRTASMRARRLFYLAAKEMFLSGVTVCCIPAFRLAEALNAEEYVGEAAMIDKVRMVFVLDFYEDGAPFPFTAYDAARMRHWVRQRYEAGSAVSFLSDSPLDRGATWWPASFLGFIGDHTVAYPV